jgi:EAL domain-containing protein (putative c-di-GMP-specific phosphodiesterase class I)
VGIEALIRWHHPVHGLMAPDQFIPVAERTGLIVDIGNWVVRRTFKQYREWFGKQGKTPAELLLSINISASQLRDETLLQLVTNIAAEESMPLGLLEIELTEHAVIQDINRCAQKLEQLVNKDIRLAIDDFGTGYASLRHLQKLPVQTLKIDRTFVMTLPDEAKSLEIIKAIIAMGRALNLRVIAGGVETALQADLLTELGCDLLQGYFFSRPEPIEQLQLT